MFELIDFCIVLKKIRPDLIKLADSIDATMDIGVQSDSSSDTSSSSSSSSSSDSDNTSDSDSGTASEIDERNRKLHQYSDNNVGDSHKFHNNEKFYFNSHHNHQNENHEFDGNHKK